MNRNSNLLFLFLALVVACVPVQGQSDKVDDYILAEMKKRQIPGLSLVVLRDGKIIKSKGYGLANVELDVLVTPETVFELASVTKQFTATAIMLLVEEGKVKLEDPIGFHLPNAPEKWKAITVWHLLTHSSGLASLEMGFAAMFEHGAHVNVATAQAFDAAAKDPISFAPGEKFQYSDVGFFLLGMIIEKASGQRYQNFLSERFFKPLGMNSTSVLDHWKILKNRAAGYTLRDGELVNIRRIVQNELPSHYGIFSTVHDLAKWDVALAAGKVLKASSLSQMWTPFKFNNGGVSNYGFGWFVNTRNGHRVITHTGITGTEYTIFPDKRLTVIVLNNLGRRVGSRNVNSWGLTFGVAANYIPELRFQTTAGQ